MKNIVTIFGFAATLLAACQGGTAKKTQAKIDSTIVKNAERDSSATSCYQFIRNRDTAYLSMVKDGDKVSGSLSYNLYEKDKNAGTITGVIKGDTILADYTFLSEGTKSIREVIWLKEGKQLKEGFGEVKDVNGKMSFADHSKINFDQHIVFEPITCK